jgi:probable HAF family extracellular repeat protein
MKGLRLTAIAAAALAAFTALSATAATTYTVTELSHLVVDPDGANEVSAGGLDAKGRAYINVSGYRDGVERAIGERCSDLSGCKQLPPKSRDSAWHSVAGSKAGGHVIDGDGVRWAARMTNGSEVELLVPDAGFTGINKAGLATGYKPQEPAVPFVYDTELHLLPTLSPGHLARAYAINDKGLVVGEAEHPQRYNACAVSWKSGVLKVLSCPPEDRNAYAYGVNSRGDIVGQSSHNKTGKMHAARFEGGKTIDMGALGDPKVNGSSATAVNNSGVAVGWGNNLPIDGMPNAIVFDPVDGALEMATLVPQADREKYMFQYPKSINDAGQILVRATRRLDFRQVVLRLDPVAAGR